MMSGSYIFYIPNSRLQIYHTKCTSPCDIFLFLYESEIPQTLVKNKEARWDIHFPTNSVLKNLQLRSALVKRHQFRQKFIGRYRYLINLYSVSSVLLYVSICLCTFSFYYLVYWWCAYQVLNNQLLFVFLCFNLFSLMSFVYMHSCFSFLTYLFDLIVIEIITHFNLLCLCFCSRIVDSTMELYASFI